jgi:hypothetical protein
VIVFPDHDAVTPEGRPVAVPIPVAPVVVCVILVNRVFIHNVGVDEAAPNVFAGVTAIVMALDVADDGTAQFAVLVMIQVTTSLFTREDEE